MPISVPKFITRAWASLGSKFDIPENSDPLTGKAGYSQGFGPVNLTPVEAGGIPPWGQDMNGILFDLSSAIQYQQAGRSFPFNQEFANAIGGYGKGAFVTNPSDQSLLYQSTIDSNTVAPPSAGWQIFSISQATDSVAGIAKVATSAILRVGTNDDSFATAKGLKDAGLWPLGVGQSWVDVSASRVSATTYTNTTGRSIAVSVRGYNPSSSVGISISVAGLMIAGVGAQANVYTSAFAVIPSGATYSCTLSNVSSFFWYELR